MQKTRRWRYAAINGAIQSRIFEANEAHDPEIWQDSPAKLELSPQPATGAPHGGMPCADIDAKLQQTCEECARENRVLAATAKDLAEENTSLQERIQTLEQKLAGIIVDEPGGPEGAPKAKKPKKGE